MEVFQSIGEKGVLKICLDDGEVVTLDFKNKVHVSVSYTSKSKVPEDIDNPSNVKAEAVSSNNEEERQKDDALDEELHRIIERVKDSEGKGGQLFTDCTKDLFMEKEKDCSETQNEENTLNETDTVTGNEKINAEEFSQSDVIEQHIESGNEIEYNEEEDDGNFDDVEDDATLLDPEDNYQDANLAEDMEAFGSVSKEGSNNDEKLEALGNDRKLVDTEDKGQGSSVATSLKSASTKNGENNSKISNLDLEGNSDASSFVKDKSVEPVKNGQSAKEDRIDQKKSQGKKAACLKGRKINAVYKCNICEGEFSDGYTLSVHQRAQNKRVVCSTCDLECMSEANLIVHQHLMHSTSSKKKGKSCPVCNKPCPKQADILCHIRSEHTGEGVYRCCVCHTMFQKYPTFSLHLDYFTKHKKCRNESEVEREACSASSSSSKIHIDTESKKSDLTIKTKPLSVILTKLSKERVEKWTSPSVSAKQKTPPVTQLKSLMNFQAPKPQVTSSVTPHPKRLADPTASKQLPGHVLLKRPMSQMPLKRPSPQMPIKRPIDLMRMKRPMDQMAMKAMLYHKMGKKAADEMLMKRSPAHPSLKRPVEQTPGRKLSGQPPVKRPYNQTPLDHVLGNRHPTGQLPKKPLLQAPLRRPGNPTPSKLPANHPLLVRKPLHQSASGTTRPQQPPNSRLSTGQSVRPQLAQRHSNLLTSPAAAAAKRSWNKLWKCHFCERVFRSKGEYINHKKPSRIMQTCKECGFTSTSKALYLIHQYQKHTHRQNDRYTLVNQDLRCHICEDPIALNEVLNHVMSKHTGEHPYECCVCKEPSRTYEQWVSHGKCHLRTPEEKDSLKTKKLVLNLTVKTGDLEKKDQFYCNICKKYYETEEEFIRHHKSETEKKECEVCQTVCYTKAGYMLHQYITHSLPAGEGKETVPSESPPANSNSEGSRTWHEDDLTNDSNVEPMKCPSCLASFPMKDLLCHVMTSHTQESPFLCCGCKTIMSNSDEYIEHCEFHLGKKLHTRGTQRCLVCGLRFDTRIRLSRHKVMHKPTCSFCQMEFTSKALLEVHLKNLHTNDMTACGFCNKLFADMNRLAEHERNHFFFKKSPCPTCGLMVTNINKHLARKHPKTDTEFLCNLCGQKFPLNCDLVRHMTTHNNDRRHECDICKKTFKRPSGLRRHAQSHLKNRLMHECPICGKKCSQRNNLSVHMRIHASVKAFTCEHCGQGFNYNQSLQTHIRKKHTGGDITPSTTATSTTLPVPVTGIVTKPEAGLVTVEAIHPVATATLPPRTTLAAPTDYPEHAVYPDPSQHFYPDPTGYLQVNSFQRSYSDLITTIVRSEPDSQQGAQQQQQQQNYSVFYPQF